MNVKGIVKVLGCHIAPSPNPYRITRIYGKDECDSSKHLHIALSHPQPALQATLWAI
jgi:hypothetical protein